MIKDVLIKGNEILKENNVQDYNLKSKILLSKILNVKKEYLLIHDDEIVNSQNKKLFFEGIEKIAKGMPIQYITNHQEFMGLDFFVNENVLIPQPDTEILVEETLSKIKKDNKILDLCTGSGAIGISLAVLNQKNAEICASDISNKALEIAKKNATENNVNLIFIESNLFENINQKFNIIVSNPPYIKSNVINELDKEVQNEPHIALDGGKDGLEFYKKIIKEAKEYLNNDGILLLEIGYDQKEDVIKLLEENNYKNIYSKKDLSGNDRIVVGNI